MNLFRYSLLLLAGAVICAARFVEVPVGSHPTFIEKQVGRDGASTVFSIFNTSPESPDGQYLFHFRYKQEPAKSGDRVPGELWICTRNLTNYRKVTDIKAMQAHDGAGAQWVDNQRIALLDSGLIRLIDIRTGKDLLKKRLRVFWLGHESFQQKILYGVNPDNGEGAPGIYELDCNTQTTRPVILIKDCANVTLPTYLTPEERWPVDQWHVYHYQYSPDGTKVDFRLDVGKPERAQVSGVCNIDGSDFTIQPKPLHQLWYDANSMIGHARFDKNGKGLGAGSRFLLMRWDKKGNVIDTLGPRGNHLAVSPDRKYFVSETQYNTNPVIVNLIPKGHLDKVVELTRFDPYTVTWDRRFHLNPSFSRNSKRVYYSKPLNEKYNGTFYCEIE